MLIVNGKEVDLSKALPLQLRDLRKLKREHGIDFGVNGIGNDIEDQAKFLTVILQKANPEITEDDVDSLTLAQMNEVSREANTASRTADVPSSASSTR